MSTPDARAGSGAEPAPNPGDVASRVAEMTPEKRALLERLLLDKRRATGSSDDIPARSGLGPWPLSHAQELMWLLDQFNPGSNAYNSPGATRLEGRLDIATLQRSLDALVARNEILRTTYGEIDGAPIQVVQPARPVRLDVVELTDRPATEQQQELDRLLQQEAERPYDLSRDAMLRAVLVRIAPDDHVLLLTVHHIAIDGWSRAVMWRALVALYDAALAGAPDPPAPALQYADWAVWHRSWLEGGVLDEQLAFWREQLLGAPELLELPTDHVRPAVRTGRGERRDVLYGRQCLDGLRHLARAERTTLFVVALAAFGTLLHRYSGQDEVVVATPIAGRNRVEVEDLVGYFMNTLAIRVDATGDPTFRELVGQVRERVLGAFAHQDVPFERVVAEVNPTRDLSRTPLCQVMLVLQNQRKDTSAPSGLTATPYRHERDWAKFDLTVGLGERDTGLNSNWEYSTDLFEATSVERMMHSYGLLLTAAVAEPDRPLSELPLATKDDQRLVAGWAAGGPRLGVGRRLPDLVADQAAATPDAPAVATDGQELTYADLMSAADRLAGRLRRHGVADGSPVVICLDRSTDLIVALLATLRAGGACVPLDPSYPAERLQLVHRESDPSVVLTSPTYAERWAAPDRAVLVLDGERVTEMGDGRRAAGQVATGPDAAYVLYTSGSTGRPKGVVLTHAGLVNSVLAGVARYRLGPADRVLQFASPGFDISIEEVFGTLAAGGCVIPRPANLPLGGAELVDWLDDQRISVLDLPTAYWHEWVFDLAARGLTPPRSLRLVVVGGERAASSAYATWRRLVGDTVAWVNTYGPSEGSVIATTYEPADDEWYDETTELPIGRPIPGATVGVLDHHCQPVPVGVPGELYLGGVGVAQGYLRDPERTATSFVELPDRPGERFYRTGDLVRWRPDGMLSFVGRLDRQVKVRGHRVELGEVEAGLAAHPFVEEAVAVLGGPPGAERVVAYAVHRGARDPDQGRALRDFVAARLPAYLVPDVVVPVDGLPLTIHGKVDQERLPSPPPPAAPRRAPRDEVEQRLCDIWRSVLGVDSLGVADNFFDLGGHSLLAVRAFAKVEEAFGARLPLATLISAPTIAELAGVIRQERPAASFRSLVPLRTTGNRPPLFLVHGILGQVLIYRDLVARLGVDQPVYALQSVSPDRQQSPLLRIADMAEHYVREIRSVQPHGPYLLGGFCFGGVIAVEMAHHLALSGDDVPLVVLFHARPYDGHTVYVQRFIERARRRLRKFLAGKARNRLRMIPETLTHIQVRHRRNQRLQAARRFLDQGQELPRYLHDIELINRMSVGEYQTPSCAAKVLLFTRSGDVERRRAMWQRFVTDLDVYPVLGADGSAANMMAEPYLGMIVPRLRSAIDAALGDEPRLCAPGSS